MNDQRLFFGQLIYDSERINSRVHENRLIVGSNALLNAFENLIERLIIKRIVSTLLDV